MARGMFSSLPYCDRLNHDRQTCPVCLNFFTDGVHFFFFLQSPRYQEVHPCFEQDPR